MSSNTSLWTWDDLVLALRALGGKADNIVLGVGKFGRGLFPQDRSKPFHLHLPERLLFSVDKIEFVDDRARIKDTAAVGAAEREFFENYQRAFSWGAVGHSECAAFIDAMDELPSDVRRVLLEEFQIGSEGDRITRIREWFLQCRLVERNNRKFVMPLVELANYDETGASGTFGSGIELSGKVEDEILAVYGRMDAVGLFQSYGFAYPSHRAFSFAMKMPLGKIQLEIDTNSNAFAQSSGFAVPHLRQEDSTVLLSHLMIGSSKNPRASRGIFRMLMKATGMPQTAADEVFDVIVHNNRLKLYELLEVVDSCKGQMAVAIRTMARYQLRAMSHCIGSRNPEEHPRPIEYWPNGFLAPQQGKQGYAVGGGTAFSVNR